MSQILSPVVFVSALFLTSSVLAPGVAFAAEEQKVVQVLTSPSGAASPEDALSAESDAAAALIAAEFGHKVEVSSETNETTKVFALPNGGMRLESSSSPVRMSTDHGWVDIDPSLSVSQSGAISPRATEVPLEFSPGGKWPLVRVQTDSGEWVSEHWPLGDLPAPTITGSTARYADVLDGVDLLLTATARGMTEVLVIESAAAAAQPELQTITLGIDGAVLSSDPDGMLTARTPQNATVRASTPMWWDSSHEESDFTGPGGNGIASKLKHVADEDGLSLAIESATSRDDVVYPVYIDPEFLGKDLSFWYIDRAYPDQSYLNGANASGSLRVGYINATETQATDGQTHLARSFFKMNTDKLAGKHITRASFEIDEVWSFSCTKSTVELWRIGSLAAGSSWSETNSSVWLEKLDGKYVAHGHSSSCPGDVVSFQAVDAVQNAADHSDDFMRLGLRAGDETENVSWKRFKESAILSVDYNSIPNKPSAPTLYSPIRSCGTSSSPSAVNSTQNLAYKSIATDGESNELLKTRFLFEDLTSPSAAEKTAYSAPLASGTTVATMPAGSGSLVHGHKYRMSATSTDGIDVSPTSSYCYVIADNVGPSIPWISNISGASYVGRPVSAKLNSIVADDVSVFAYWWSYAGNAGDAEEAPVLGGPATIITPPSSGQVFGPYRLIAPNADGTVTISGAPKDSISTLWVASYDAAGNVSKQNLISTSGAQVTVANDPAVSYSAGHAWLISKATVPEQSPLQSPFADENVSIGTSPVSAASLTLGAGTPLDSQETLVGTPGLTHVLSIPATSSASTTSHAVVDVGKSFTVSAWVRVGAISLTDDQVAVSQSGAGNSGFALKVGASGKLEFCVRWDTTSTTERCAVGPVPSTGTPSSKAWQLVTGIWDSSNKEVRLLQNNSITAVGAKGLTAAEAAGSSNTTSADNGVLVVGWEKVGAAFINRWKGAISDVTVVPGVVSNGQLTDMFGHIPLDPANDQN